MVGSSAAVVLTVRFAPTTTNTNSCLILAHAKLFLFLNVLHVPAWHVAYGTWDCN
jgi:hypothetical protein